MIEIIKDIKYPTMFRLKWDNGDTSQDIYNYTRAVELAFLCKQRTIRYSAQKTGEVWEFPEMGREKAYNGRTFILHGTSYPGSQWSEITHQTRSKASYRVSGEKEAA